MKIIFPPRVRKILIAILFVVILAIALLALRSTIFPPHPVQEAGLAPDAQAAVNAVTAFYTMDYTRSPELWVSNVCAFATDQGCNAIRSFFAPSILKQVKDNHIQTGCRVQPIRLVEGDGDVRIWQVRVTLDHPWASLDTPEQDVYVEMAKEQSGWLMNRILFNQEIERFSTPTH